MKEHFKSEKDTRQGAPRPLAPSARDFIPCNPTGEKTSWGRENNFRLLRRIKWKIEGFWPTESRENPRGESSLSHWDYSPAFPGCFASGLAAFSRRARSTTASSNINESPGKSFPWRGVWGRGGPSVPLVSYLKCSLKPTENCMKEGQYSDLV